MDTVCTVDADPAQEAAYTDCSIGGSGAPPPVGLGLPVQGGDPTAGPTGGSGYGTSGGTYGSGFGSPSGFGKLFMLL